jgi:hypothetical protein
MESSRSCKGVGAQSRPSVNGVELPPMQAGSGPRRWQRLKKRKVQRQD